MIVFALLLFPLVFELCVAKDYDHNAASSSANAKILNYHSENIGTGQYHFAFASSDGIERREEGALINPNTENEALAVSGSYSYVGPNGVTYTVKYVADQNGFRPEGDHIHVPTFMSWTRQQFERDDSRQYGTQVPVPKADSNIYLASVQRPTFSNSIPVYPRPLVNSIRPLLADILSSPIKPQVVNAFHPPDIITYIPTQSNVENSSSENQQSENVPKEVDDVLNSDTKDNKEESVKIEQINAL